MTAATPPGPGDWLEELTALREAATPGPWFAWDRGVGWVIAVEDPEGVEHLPGRPEPLPEGTRTDLGRAEDAALVVAAVNALPALVGALRAVLDRADEEIADAEAAARFAAELNQGAALLGQEARADAWRTARAIALAAVRRDGSVT